MQLEDTPAMNLLCDFYGGLLKQKQREIFRMYYSEDLSLSEIAANLGISRQAVHGSLRKSAAALEEYESRLGLAAKYAMAERTVARAGAALERLAGERASDADLADRLRGIRAMIDHLEL
jgi:predicted DNA-binding protein YlxM (UPF0122 family)